MSIISDLAETIIWVAKERKVEHTNLISAILSVTNDVDLILCEYLKKIIEDERQ